MPKKSNWKSAVESGAKNYVKELGKAKSTYNKARNIPEATLLANAIDKRLSQIEWSLRRLEKLDHKAFKEYVTRLSDVTATMQALRERR